MPVEKAHLILALVDPREVAARIHQPHQEQPGLAARSIDVHQHFEEIALGEIAPPIRERHEDLAALSLPFRDRVFDDRHAHAVPFGPQQLVQPRGRQPLLAARPSHRFGQQRLHPVGDRVPDRPGPRPSLQFPHWGRLIHVLANSDPRQPQLAGDGPLRARLEGRNGVRLLGRVPHSDVPGLIAGAHVLCQPSLIEPLGQAVLEGMASGRSVVATRIGGPPEFVKPDAGVLVDPLDVDALAGALRRAAALPRPNEAARAAAAAHDVRRQAERIEAILSAAAGSRDPRS